MISTWLTLDDVGLHVVDDDGFDMVLSDGELLDLGLARVEDIDKVKGVK